MRKEQQCKENTAFICRCVRRVHEHQIHNQLIKICFVGKYGSIEPIYFTSRSRIYEQTGLVLQASKHISHVNVYGRYEVTILGAFMAPISLDCHGHGKARPFFIQFIAFWEKRNLHARHKNNVVSFHPFYRSAQCWQH